MYGGESILEALVLVCLVSFDQSLIRHSSVSTHLRCSPVALFYALGLCQTQRRAENLFRNKDVFLLLLTSLFCRHNRDF